MSTLSASFVMIDCLTIVLAFSCCSTTLTFTVELVNMLRICSTVPVSARRTFWANPRLMPYLASTSAIFCSMKLPKSSFFRIVPATEWVTIGIMKRLSCTQLVLWRRLS